MATTDAGDDLLRLIGVGGGWDFDPPLPALWARRLRRVTGIHPSGARLELVWTLTGGIADATTWVSARGAVVEFAPIVPPARDALLMALLTTPDDTQQQADETVATHIADFWSTTPRRLNDRVRASMLEGQPEPQRQQLIDHMELVDRRLQAYHQRSQQRARRRGWHPPTP